MLFSDVHIHLPSVAKHQCRVFVPQSLPRHGTDAHLQLSQRLSLALFVLILGDRGRGRFRHSP